IIIGVDHDAIQSLPLVGSRTAIGSTVPRAPATEASTCRAQPLTLGVGGPSQGAAVGGMEPDVIKIHWFPSAIKVAGRNDWGGNGSSGGNVIGSGGDGDIGVPLALLCTSV